MKRYEKYKPSGIEWLPEIPVNWEMKKTKHCFQYTTGFTPPTGHNEYYNGEFVWVTIADMNKKYVNDSNTKLAQEAINNFKPDITPQKSLLYSFKLSVGKVAFAGKDLYTNEAIISIPPNEKIDLRYFYYALPEQLLQNANKNIYGAKILNQELIRNAFVSVPTFIEQTTIANYLDEKTARIDNLIANKQKLIELLKEKRTIIINQAVTKGIAPNVKLKPSGIEWLEDIPEHWELKKLKYVTSLRSGESITADNIRQEDEYPVFGGNGLRGFTSEYTHDGDFILIGRQGALCGNVNYAKDKFWASEHAVVISRFNKENIVWLGELLRVMNLNQYSMSAAQPGLSVKRIENLFIPYPSIEEQQKIGNRIESLTKPTDITLTKIENEIELLQEYRTALIGKVVTGKIKVI